MQFRTELKPEKSSFQISESSPQLWLGSCFASSMGSRLLEAKFPVMLNPFGVIFNPLSLFRLLHKSLYQAAPAKEKFLTHENLCYHFDYHSQISANSEEKLQQYLMHLHSQVRASLLNSQYLVITFGTAYVYHLKDSRGPVANCHKQPSKLFEKKLLSIEEILEAFSEVYALIQQQHPALKIILTLSPIRHLKDTLPLNAVSKATLRLAAHQICTAYNSVSYFPAYELLLDDLRDYRFYGSDMLHPSPQAEAYIWEKFQEVHLTDTAQDWLKEWSEIRSALAHRPFNPGSEAHQKFLKSTLQKLQELHKKRDVSAEIAQITSQIKTQS